MIATVAAGLILAVLAPLGAMELPRRFAVADAALDAQFAEQADGDALPSPIAVKPEAKQRKSRAKLYLSAALTTGIGAVAYWSKQRADQAYDRYLYSANLTRQDEEFDKAKRFDRMAGASYIGMEVGLILSSYLLFFGR